MLSADRAEFVRLVEMLCAGFNVPPIEMRIEAYWRGLQKMDLPVFARVVEYVLGGNGPEKIPTVPQLWNLQREMRRTARASAPTTSSMSAPAFDSFHGFGQRCLLRFLMDRRGVSTAEIARLVAEKNLLVDQFRSIASEEEITAEEVREAMFAAFRKAGDGRAA